MTNINNMPKDFNNTDLEQWRDSRGVSETEAIRIMDSAESMAEAQDIWENQDWWND